MAQVRAVVQGEAKMWPNLWKALGIAWRNIAKLFRVYLCISGVALVSLAVGVWLWTQFKPTWTPATFVLLELIILFQLLTRLWQRASLVTWYKGHALEVPADAVAFTTPAPVEITEESVLSPEAVPPLNEEPTQ